MNLLSDDGQDRDRDNRTAVYRLKGPPAADSVLICTEVSYQNRKAETSEIHKNLRIFSENRLLFKNACDIIQWLARSAVGRLHAVDLTHVPTADQTSLLCAVLPRLPQRPVSVAVRLLSPGAGMSWICLPQQGCRGRR